MPLQGSEPNSRSIISPPPHVAFDGLPDALCVAAVEAHRASRTLDNASSRRQEIGFLGRLRVLVGAGRWHQCFVVDLDNGQVRFFLVVLFGRLTALRILFVGRFGQCLHRSSDASGLAKIEGSVFVRPQVFEADLLLKLRLPVLVLDDDLELQGIGNVHAGVEVVVEVGVAEAHVLPRFRVGVDDLAFLVEVLDRQHGGKVSVGVWRNPQLHARSWRNGFPLGLSLDDVSVGGREESLAGSTQRSNPVVWVPNVLRIVKRARLLVSDDGPRKPGVESLGCLARQSVGLVKGGKVTEVNGFKGFEDGREVVDSGDVGLLKRKLPHQREQAHDAFKRELSGDVRVFNAVLTPKIPRFFS